MRWLAFALGTALLTACNKAPASKACLASDHQISPNDRGDMVWVPSGSAILGSTRFQPEEAPTRSISVAGFWIDRHEVTNAEFSAFVTATGYRTLAEKSGGAVFHQPDAIGDPSDYRRWWRLDTTANWRMPHGRQDAAAQADKPVVQITYADALA
jgi:formylglycine-generating enzyme